MNHCFFFLNNPESTIIELHMCYLTLKKIASQWHLNITDKIQDAKIDTDHIKCQDPTIFLFFLLLFIQKENCASHSTASIRHLLH